MSMTKRDFEHVAYVLTDCLTRVKSLAFTPSESDDEFDKGFDEGWLVASEQVLQLVIQQMMEKLDLVYPNFNKKHWRNWFKRHKSLIELNEKAERINREREIRLAMEERREKDGLQEPERTSD